MAWPSATQQRFVVRDAVPSNPEAPFEDVSGQFLLEMHQERLPAGSPEGNIGTEAKEATRSQ